jgi:hypothetical protein
VCGLYAANKMSVMLMWVTRGSLCRNVAWSGKKSHSISEILYLTDLIIIYIYNEYITKQWHYPFFHLKKYDITLPISVQISQIYFDCPLKFFLSLFSFS